MRSSNIVDNFVKNINDYTITVIGTKKIAGWSKNFKSAHINRQIIRMTINFWFLQNTVSNKI